MLLTVYKELISDIHRESFLLYSYVGVSSSFDQMVIKTKTIQPACAQTSNQHVVDSTGKKCS